MTAFARMPAEMDREGTFKLPKPISVNATKTRDSRFLSKQYKAWKLQAAYMLMSQRARAIIPPYRVSIFIPRTCRIDVDNAAKPILDALEESGVLTNDRNVDELNIERSYNHEETTVRVEALGV